ncbi:response regulator transcription factor [bacterium]|nr:response regulator transcription factor [bacterium]
MKDKVLCIDDDLTTQALVEASLANYQVVPALTIKDADQLLLKQQFEALVIDIQLPDGDGLRYVNKLLQVDKIKEIPMFVFSNHKELSNKVMAFSLGADDFIEKPFDPIEFKARIESRIHKKKLLKDLKQILQIGDILLDLDRQKAFHVINNEEKDLQLTSYELKILKMLSKRLEQVYSREQILQNVWGETFISDRTVDSHIAHLRQKIADTKLSINTVKNFGYSLSIKKG